MMEGLAVGVCCSQAVKTSYQPAFALIGIFTNTQLPIRYLTKNGCNFCFAKMLIQ